MLYLNVIVSNLDRRRDRWYMCLGALLALGFTPGKITRFSAHDARIYRHQNDARQLAMARHPEAAFLDNNMKVASYYYWAWTWYDIMWSIANQPQARYTLFLVDDVAPCFTYKELIDQLSILEQEHTVKLIQCLCNNRIPGACENDPPIVQGERVLGMPFRHGLTHPGDAMNVFSAKGAQEVLNVANTRQCYFPNTVFWYVAQDLPQSGYFSADNNVPSLGRILNRNPWLDPYEDGRESRPHVPHYQTKN